ncbi:porin [Kozakia baliensis]|uniref:Porin n=2 Tax=Kozakia baliensis TaxID=153496 RepID=A0A1D8UXK0_9PROT|nr:porin [Kozakia baliensis]
MFKASSRLTFGAAMFVSFGVHTAHAQVLDNDIGSEPNMRVDTPLPAKPSNKTTVPPFARPEAVFSDPMGLTNWLRARGIALLIDNTNEFAGAVTKPTPGFVNYRQGASNAGQYAISLNMDWEKLAGIKGFATHMITVGRYGTTANRMFGDWLNHASEVYGGGGNVVVHLVMAYGEETLLGGRVALAAGRMSEMSDFVASPLYCNFQNGSMCGRPKNATDSAFTSGYPAAVWAARARGRPSRFTYLQMGVYLAENGIYQNFQHRTGFKFNGSNIVGTRIPLEFGWEPLLNGNLPGHYKVGGVLMTAPTADMYEDIDGLPYALTHRAQRMHKASYGAWTLMDQRIVNYNGGKDDSGITALWGFLYNDKHTSLREWEAYGAVIDRGFWKARPLDTIGLAFTYTKISPGVQISEELLRAQNRSMPNHATGIQRHTSVFEANYAIHVMRGVIFQPLFEYFIRPNGQGNLRNAELLGFKSHIEFL